MPDKSPGIMGNLYYQGHVYKDAGPSPCPVPGYENLTISTKYNGKPAYWKNGHIYVLDPATVKKTKYNQWAHK